MDGYPEYRISVTEPVNWALSWTKQVLFAPFDLGKWFVIGFCAWLATLGEGGCNFGGSWNRDGGSRESIEQGIREGGEYVAQNAVRLIPVVIIVLVIALGAAVLLAWLRSRGKFMFLYCVAQNTAEVARPWSFYRRQGNSLFLFLLLLGVLIFAAMAPFIWGTAFALISLDRAGMQLPLFGLLAFCTIMAVGIGIVGALIAKFTRDFVVPIMYLRQNTVTEAWREFRGMLSANAGRFALYILFYILITLVIGSVLFALILVTCCCAGCVMALPYLGTVLLLPILVFKRSYSTFYLAQYGPEYNVFMPPPSNEPADEGNE